MESITSNLNQSSIHVEQVTRQIAAASDEVVAHVSLAAGNLPDVTSNMVASIELVQSMIHDSNHDLDQILLNLRYITEDTKEFIRMIKRHPGMLLSEPPDKNLSVGGKK